MKNLVLLLLLVCTLHGICVSLECYKCNTFDEGCQAPPVVEFCPYGSICHVTQITEADGDVVSILRGCIPDSECHNGCSGFVMESLACTSCCNEDYCNSGVPNDEDVSCYDCWDVPTTQEGLGSTACNNPSNPDGALYKTKTCSYGQCTIYYTKNLSKINVLYRGCPMPDRPCWSQQTRCGEDGICIDCCSGNLCNGQAISLANNGQATASVAHDRLNILVMSLASNLLKLFINNWI